MTTTSWTRMAELLAGLPNLEGARCVGRADLFEATIATHSKPDTKTELARTAALCLCAACPALQPCRAWLNQQRQARRPRGVVAGRVVRSDGRIRTAKAQVGP